MKLFLLLAITLALQDNSIAKEPPTPSLKQFSEMIMTTPCYTGLELPARDSASAIRFIKKLTVSTKGLIKPKVFSIKPNTTDYLITSQNKNEQWSIWVSVGKQGIRHITETWQSPSESILKKHLYESMSSLIDSWGEISDENEDGTWFKWDRTDFGCGVMTLIYVQEKKQSFVSRRLLLNEN